MDLFSISSAQPPTVSVTRKNASFLELASDREMKTGLGFD